MQLVDELVKELELPEYVHAAVTDQDRRWLPAGEMAF
jgi:hypothetical protein